MILNANKENKGKSFQKDAQKEKRRKEGAYFSYSQKGHLAWNYPSKSQDRSVKGSREQLKKVTTEEPKEKLAGSREH
ncbi:hypothetical protein DPSP01_014014 [Paraphaeosphaeria sporulosa]